MPIITEPGPQHGLQLPFLFHLENSVKVRFRNWFNPDILCSNHFNTAKVFAKKADCSMAAVSYLYHTFYLYLTPFICGACSVTLFPATKLLQSKLILFL